MRNLPADVEIEKTILGACLLEDEYVDEARVVLNASDFFLDSHRRIFAAIMRLDNANLSVDTITVCQALKESKELDSVGVGYVSDLTTGVPRKISFKDYVGIVKEHARRRKLIALSEAAIAAAEDADKPIGIMARMQDGIQGILDDSDVDDPSVGSYSVKALDRFHQQKRLTESPGLSFGLKALDESTGGMRPGEVALVGARSGIGKTALVCQALVENCRAGIRCCFFSLEMTRFQVLERLWSIVSGVAYKKITDPWLANVDDSARVEAAAAEVAEWPLDIHDKGEMHLSQIVAIARIAIRRKGAKLIAVDYAQEVNSDGSDVRTRVMATAQGLKAMIKHESATLILLSQLLKGNRDSNNKAPIVSDLIESGKLENIAHVIILLHRTWDEEARRISSEAAIIIPKQRRGETGIIQAKFNKKIVIFEGV